MKRQRANGFLDGLSKEQIVERRLNIAPVANSVVNVVDSEDEDAQRDLLFRRRLYLKKARAVASNRHTKGGMLLEALERPGVSKLHVSDLLELAEANVPHQGASTTSLALSRTIVPESPLSSPECSSSHKC